jgi:very-short-patch-repair endonuclease
MNAVEIEEAVSQLAGAPFHPEEFPFAFLEAFGNKPTTLKRLKSGNSNQSDLTSGVLQRHNIHIKVCAEGEVSTTLTALRESPATLRQKAKFILATDGKSFEAENLADGETVACAYPDFHHHFGFFLPLAGITTVKQIRENAFDIKATGRLNRLYVELLKENPDWDTDDRREAMNQLMARLIFCFFAEDTNIFYSEGLFTQTVAQMSAGDASNTHEVLAEVFRAMCTPLQERAAVGIRNWADGFPYVNGGLFSPHPLTPSPMQGEGGQDNPAPLFRSERGAGGEGMESGDFPHTLTPSPMQGEGGQENPAPLSRSERGAGGEGVKSGDFPHTLTPSPMQGEGGQENPAPLSRSGRGAGGEGMESGNGEQEDEYWEIPLALKRKMTEVAREFRKKPTPSENILWQALRGRKLEGRKFRRQQPIGTFIVDFFCGSERLIVEVDGGVHKSQKAADQQRQELLESLGLRVVRVPSKLVETNLDEALAVVRRAFSPHPLTPSPQQGEGGQENPAPLFRPGRGAGGEGVPRFNKIARSYLLHVGNLDWKQINPDIFGSMIQAVADEEERGALGMHYTSVPNILKVLNPLFLDDLRAQLEAAGENGRKLWNLRQRMARIRVFDPACGSGNFLVIAYKEMRAIEAEINRRREESNRKSEIPLTNFRGIEIRHFACEIARLALIIAEYQCDVLYLGQQEARLLFLPLKKDNWITWGNALRLDWLSICPPTGTGVKVQREDLDLWGETQEQAEIEFENEGGETYICGNPPYLGSTWQSAEQKDDLKLVFEGRTKTWKSLDYVAGWFMKAADYGTQTKSAAAFVSTNSICQGQQVPILWPLIFATGHEIAFAHTSFKWANLASHNAGVTVVIVGISNQAGKVRWLFSSEDNSKTVARETENINAYLVTGSNTVVSKTPKSVSKLADMDYGNKPTDDGGLILSTEEKRNISKFANSERSFIRRFIGSNDAIDGSIRYCLWIENEMLREALKISIISERLEKVKSFRERSSKLATKEAANWSHRFQEVRQKGNETPIVIPRHSSENRGFLPFLLCEIGTIVADSAFALYDVPLWNMALIASRLHLVWIATVCGKLKTDFRYSNTLGWNTFPVPTLTEQNKADLTRCAENILLAREHYFPATIADMYDPDRMDSEFPLVREAHDRNDEILERIYIGRRFKNDTERLEKLFELYTKMTSQQTAPKKSAKRKKDQ